MARRTRNFAEVIHAQIRNDPEFAELVRKESFNADVAQKVYDLRTKAGLTQRELAERVGTSQSVISRIEDADYDGHSLKVLNRIAVALGVELRVQFSQAEAKGDVPAKSVSIGSGSRDVGATSVT